MIIESPRATGPMQTAASHPPPASAAPARAPRRMAPDVAISYRLIRLTISKYDVNTQTYNIQQNSIQLTITMFEKYMCINVYIYIYICIYMCIYTYIGPLNVYTVAPAGRAPGRAPSRAQQTPPER